MAKQSRKMVVMHGVRDPTRGVKVTVRVPARPVAEAHVAMLPTADAPPTASSPTTTFPPPPSFQMSKNVSDAVLWRPGAWERGEWPTQSNRAPTTGEVAADQGAPRRWRLRPRRDAHEHYHHQQQHPHRHCHHDDDDDRRPPLRDVLVALTLEASRATRVALDPATWPSGRDAVKHCSGTARDAAAVVTATAVAAASGAREVAAALAARFAITRLCGRDLAHHAGRAPRDSYPPGERDPSDPPGDPASASAPSSPDAKFCLHADATDPLPAASGSGLPPERLRVSVLPALATLAALGWTAVVVLGVVAQVALARTGPAPRGDPTSRLLLALSAALPGALTSRVARDISNDPVVATGAFALFLSAGVLLAVAHATSLADLDTARRAAALRPGPTYARALGGLPAWVDSLTGGRTTRGAGGGGGRGKARGGGKGRGPASADAGALPSAAIAPNCRPSEPGADGQQNSAATIAGERARWLSALIATAWPFLAAGGASAAARELGPSLNATRPAYVGVLSLRRAALGPAPPTVSNVVVRMLPRVPNPADQRDEVAERRRRWRDGGDCDIGGGKTNGDGDDNSDFDDNKDPPLLGADVDHSGLALDFDLHWDSRADVQIAMSGLGGGGGTEHRRGAGGTPVLPGGDGSMGPGDAATASTATAAPQQPPKSSWAALGVLVQIQDVVVRGRVRIVLAPLVAPRALAVVDKLGTRGPPSLTLADLGRAFEDASLVGGMSLSFLHPPLVKMRPVVSGQGAAGVVASVLGTALAPALRWLAGALVDLVARWYVWPDRMRIDLSDGFPDEARDKWSPGDAGGAEALEGVLRVRVVRGEGLRDGTWGDRHQAARAAAAGEGRGRAAISSLDGDEDDEQAERGKRRRVWLRIRSGDPPARTGARGGPDATFDEVFHMPVRESWVERLHVATRIQQRGTKRVVRWFGGSEGGWFGGRLGTRSEREGADAARVRWINEAKDDEAMVPSGVANLRIAALIDLCFAAQEERLAAGDPEPCGPGAATVLVAVPLAPPGGDRASADATGRHPQDTAERAAGRAAAEASAEREAGQRGFVYLEVTWLPAWASVEPPLPEDEAKAARLAARQRAGRVDADDGLSSPSSSDDESLDADGREEGALRASFARPKLCRINPIRVRIPDPRPYGLLRVAVVQVRNLPRTNVAGWCNPYVSVCPGRRWAGSWDPAPWVKAGDATSTPPRLAPRSPFARFTSRSKANPSWVELRLPDDCNVSPWSTDGGDDGRGNSDGRLRRRLRRKREERKRRRAERRARRAAHSDRLLTRVQASTLDRQARAGHHDETDAWLASEPPIPTGDHSLPKSLVVALNGLALTVVESGRSDVAAALRTVSRFSGRETTPRTKRPSLGLSGGGVDTPRAGSPQSGGIGVGRHGGRLVGPSSELDPDANALLQRATLAARVDPRIPARRTVVRPADPPPPPQAVPSSATSAPNSPIETVDRALLRGRSGLLDAEAVAPLHHQGASVSFGETFQWTGVRLTNALDVAVWDKGGLWAPDILLGHAAVPLEDIVRSGGVGWAGRGRDVSVRLWGGEGAARVASAGGAGGVIADLRVAWVGLPTPVGGGAEAMGASMESR